MYYFKFSDTEIKKLLSENLVIVCDTNEQENSHILSYFTKKKVKYKKAKIPEGDYTAIITARPEMGIYRDLNFPVAVERKAHINEFIGNLMEETDSRDDIRLIREFQRAKVKGIKMFLMIEEKNGLENIKKGNYRSKFSVKAVLGRLSSIQDLYLSDTIFVPQEEAGFEIFRKLYYGVRNYLKELNPEIAEFDYGIEEDTEGIL
ncbi:ERCC4 domain-containing protein [Clostridium cellulovorans]|uniref:ERCC4 domain-containing protein n=1 Tax=Clostridium cellulovorans (strain ATCC 35296 / DSM 3052 / OCM 3 / 743B) TaxID=573061 RepID=D9SWF0_CLOC7|nr:ERCC4 domain-containing protein [Clostridium cellulovorans]ADL53232.1 hypothetical protein Clocel_3556 [Clostridium cellulovorans 743B]